MADQRNAVVAGLCCRVREPCTSEERHPHLDDTFFIGPLNQDGKPDGTSGLLNYRGKFQQCKEQFFQHSYACKYGIALLNSNIGYGININSQ